MSEVVAALQACRGSSPANAVDAPVPPGESAATNGDSQQVELITSQKKDTANLKSADTATPAANINSSFSPPLDQETVVLPWARATGHPKYLQVLSKLRQRSVIVAAILLGALSLAAVAGLVILRPKAGTLVVELSEPDVSVRILSGRGVLEIERPGEKDRMTFAVAPGPHQLRLTKAGTDVFAKDFAMAAGGRVVIAARWEASQPSDGATRVSSSNGGEETRSANSIENRPDAADTSLSTGPYEGIGSVKWTTMFPDPKSLIGWETAGRTFRYDNGELTLLRVAGGPDTMSLLYLSDFQDVIFRVKVRLSTCGVWMTIRGGVHSITLFLLPEGQGGDLSLRKGTPEHGQFAAAALRHCRVNSNLNEYHEVALAAVGRTYLVYFDGSKVLDACDSHPPTRGKLCLSVGGPLSDPVFTQPAYAALDDVQSLTNLRRRAVDSDREVAEWLIAMVGSARIRVGSREMTVSDIASIPDERIAVVEARFPPQYIGLEADPILTMFRNLLHLESLDLSGTSVTDDGLRHISNLETLKFLDLSRTRITAAAASQLKFRLQNCRIQLDPEILKAVEELQKQTQR
jgi:hypothetical protein